MKFLRYFSPGVLALAMSFGVTAGSLYVTVSTATNNEAAVFTSSEAVAETVLIGSEADAAESALAAASIELSEDGSLIGRISGIDVASGELTPSDDVSIVLSSHDGTNIETDTGADGTFSFGGLKPGIYTVSAAGSKGRLSCGIRLVRGYDSVAANEATPVSIDLDLQLDSALAPARDSSTLDALISGVEVTPVTPGPAEETHSELSDGVSGGSTGNYLGHEQLALSPDGSLAGRVSLLDPVTGGLATVTDLTVSFITENEVVAVTDVNADGSFTQHNMLPGIYTMAVTGSDAIAYVGVDVVGGLTHYTESGEFMPASSNIRQEAAVGAAQGAGAGAAGAGAATGGNDDDGGALLPNDGGFAGAPAGPGGGVGAGGGVAAGGGFGGLLGLALGGALGAALADDDDGSAASPAN